MPNLILDLMVDRVDLVDEGANSQAFIKLYKRKENPTLMKFEDILKAMKPEHAEVIKQEVSKSKAEVPEATEQELAKAKKELDQANKDLQAKEEEIKKSKKETKDDEEPDFEEVMKSLDPKVQQIFANLNAQKLAAEEVAKRAAEEKITNEAIAKAKELKALPTEESNLVEILKSASPEVHEILKAANKAIEDNGIFTEVGKSKTEHGTDASDAWAKIEKKAEVIEQEQKVSKAKAISMAVAANPDLYKEYLEGGAN